MGRLRLIFRSERNRAGIPAAPDLQIRAQPGGNLQIPVPYLQHPEAVKRQSEDCHPVGRNLKISPSGFALQIPTDKPAAPDLQIRAQPGGNLQIPVPFFQNNLFHNYICQVTGDRDRLGQVLINFITNAIKYSPGGSEVQVEVSKSPEGQVVVSVTDEGIGIDKKTWRRFFSGFTVPRGPRSIPMPVSG